MGIEGGVGLQIEESRFVEGVAFAIGCSTVSSGRAQVPYLTGGSVQGDPLLHGPSKSLLISHGSVGVLALPASVSPRL